MQIKKKDCKKVAINKCPWIIMLGFITWNFLLEMGRIKTGSFLFNTWWRAPAPDQIFSNFFNQKSPRGVTDKSYAERSSSNNQNIREKRNYPLPPSRSDQYARVIDAAIVVIFYPTWMGMGGSFFPRIILQIEPFDCQGVATFSLACKAYTCPQIDITANWHLINHIFNED